MEMSSELSSNLFQDGSFMVLLDVPVGTEFGIDFQSWKTGPKFKGVKMIPPGIHFVYYSTPRTGFFHKFQKGECVAKRWNPESETADIDVSPTDVQRLKEDIRNLDRNLGAYPFEQWKKWISLTNRISEATIQRLEPTHNGIISSASVLVPEKFISGMEQPRNEELDEDNLPKLEHQEGTNIRYTELPPKYPPGATPVEITKNSMDTSFQLESLLKVFGSLYNDQVSSSMSSNNQTEEVLAELQFSFICFLVGQNYDSFEQWKKLLIMFCSCDEVLEKYPDLFSNLITDMHFQIREVPDDFFVDIVSSNNFLVSILTKLFNNVRTGDNIQAGLKTKIEKFRTNLSKKFNWEFESEDEGDDAPVIVQTT